MPMSHAQSTTASATSSSTGSYRPPSGAVPSPRAPVRLKRSLVSIRVVKAVTYDVRFPTSRTGAGSDAMNPDPDYSAAYVALETDDPGGLTGHGLPFPIGRGTEV